MASTSSTKIPCATCGDKNAGIFRCEGCLAVFCRKHSNEHRDLLSQQLNEIIHQHDTLQQSILEKKNQNGYGHHLITEIDKWEKNSIEKIHQTAEEVRQRIEELLKLENEKALSKLHDVAEQIRKAQQDDDFVEKDLRLLTNKLEELKINTTNFLLREDPNITLISKLEISEITHQIFQDERLVSMGGNIRIENNNQTAIHFGPRLDSYIRGTNEYSVGRHEIRFTMNRKNTDSPVAFGITAKTEHFRKWWPSSSYGWLSDGRISDGGLLRMDRNSSQNDMEGKTSFTIELLVDCDNPQIKYSNIQMNTTRMLNIDLEKCPFPWQIFFYLWETEDCVQLL